MRVLIVILAVLLTTDICFAEFLPTSRNARLNNQVETASENFTQAVDNTDAKIAKQNAKLKAQNDKYMKKKFFNDIKIQQKQKEREEFINFHQQKLEKKRQELQNLLEEK